LIYRMDSRRSYDRYFRKRHLPCYR